MVAGEWGAPVGKNANKLAVCTENLIRVDDALETPKLTE
jgi:hypothetical protein